MKSVLVQYGYRQHEKLIDLTEPHHDNMCAKLDIDYVTFRHKPKGHPYWEKPKLLFSLLAAYSQVIWLDADTLWIDGDIRAANTTHPFGMTWHHLENPQHYNAGAIYLHNSPYTIQLVDEWLSTPDDGHKWADQWALNKVIQNNPESINTISHEWNCMPQYTHASPKVLAWHGHDGYCEQSMRHEMAARSLL